MSIEDEIASRADRARSTYLNLREYLHEVGRLRERSDTIRHINKLKLTAHPEAIDLLFALARVLERGEHETVSGGALRVDDENAAWVAAALAAAGLTEEQFAAWCRDPNFKNTDSKYLVELFIREHKR